MDLLNEAIKSGAFSVDELTHVLKCEIDEFEKNFGRGEGKEKKSANNRDGNINIIIELLRQRLFVLSEHERNIIVRTLVDTCSKKYSIELLHEFGKKITYDIDCTITVVNDKSCMDRHGSIVESVPKWVSEIAIKVIIEDALDFIKQNFEGNYEELLSVLLPLLIYVFSYNLMKK